MQMYVNYEFYKEKYMGKLPQSIFFRFSLEAQAVIDYHTFDRIKKLDKDSEHWMNIKFAVCSLTEYLYKLDTQGGKEIASETTASHSITYVDESETDNRSMEAKILRKWLNNTGLLYRGVYDDD